MCSCIICGNDFTLNSSAAEAAGNKYSVHCAQNFIGVCIIFKGFGIYPVNIHCRMGCNSAVLQGFIYGNIAVVQLNIFAHHCNFHGLLRVSESVQHLLPVS